MTSFHVLQDPDPSWYYEDDDDHCDLDDDDINTLDLHHLNPSLSAADRNPSLCH